MKVYVLQSLIDESQYVGMSADENKRQAEHNAGRVRSTKGKRPWKIVYVEEYDTLVEARARKIFKDSCG